jgi:succinyl-CoA synthetase beta subunit
VIAHGLWQVFQDFDATMVEINPLVISSDHKLIALDGKMTIDDNALFRHPEMTDFRDQDYQDAVETGSRKFGLSYIKLDGNIGCLVNGAGLAMTTMDVIHIFGGKPANFLDIGGGAGAEKVAAALRIILANPEVKAILINVFGGITRCDEVAKGIIEAINEVKPTIPIITRLDGTNAKEGIALLKGFNLMTADSISKAAELAVTASKGVVTV